MTFDDRLRDELRRATASAPLDTDDALAAVKATHGATRAAAPSVDEPAIVALEDDAVRRPRHVKTKRLIGVAAAIALIVGAIAIPLALRDRGHGADDAARRGARDPKHLSVNRAALEAVASALDATAGVGSFRVAYTMTEVPGARTTNPCPTIAPGQILSNGVNQPSGASRCVFANTNNVRTVGIAIVNLDPYALISVSDVSSLGQVTVRADDTNVWEQGGANYGLEGTGITGPGQSLSGFASLVEGTLGRREGAGAMMGLASPYGYLSVVHDAIIGAEQTGTGEVNGAPVTVYRVRVDPAQLASAPGLTPEQVKTINAAVAVLHEEGFSGNTTDVSVDERGFVVRVVSVNHFADGGSVTGDNTMSAFGCAGAIQMPGRPVTATTVPPSCSDGTTAPPPLIPETTVTASNDVATVTVAPAAPTATTPRTLSTVDPRSSTTVVISSGGSR